MLRIKPILLLVFTFFSSWLGIDISGLEGHSTANRYFLSSDAAYLHLLDSATNRRWQLRTRDALVRDSLSDCLICCQRDGSVFTSPWQLPSDSDADSAEMDEDASITSLITSYHELNPTVLDELCAEPTALEFMRYVSRNRPFVVRGGAKHWHAVRKWDAEYLRDRMKGRDVKVAVTPHG